MCFWGCFLHVFQKSSSFCRENEIFENKKQNKQKIDQFLTYKKGNLGPVFNFTAYIYIYCGSTGFSSVNKKLLPKEPPIQHPDCKDHKRPRSLFRIVKAPSRKECSGLAWDQDGPADTNSRLDSQVLVKGKYGCGNPVAW